MEGILDREFLMILAIRACISAGIVLIVCGILMQWLRIELVDVVSNLSDRNELIKQKVTEDSRFTARVRNRILVLLTNMIITILKWSIIFLRIFDIINFYSVLESIDNEENET